MSHFYPQNVTFPFPPYPLVWLELFDRSYPQMLHAILLSFSLALGAITGAQAQQYNIQNVARLDILPGYPTPTGHMVAAHIQLEDGWKTYWRAPGSNGIPPTFDWTGSQNVGSVTFFWPEPRVFEQDGVRTIGYKHELILPIDITAIDPNKPISLKGNVSFGVCDDVCLPAKARFRINLAGTDPASKTAITAALRNGPQSGTAAGLGNLHCQITPTKDGFRIESSVISRTKLAANTFTVFEFPHPDIWIDSDSTSVQGNTLTASANLYAFGDTPLILDRSKITVTLLGGSRAIELRGCPS
jgi:DsbC/DsbD-like thiol-disulfide interchange protein